MLDGHTPLAHPPLPLPIRHRIRHIRPYALQNKVPLAVAALEGDHATTPPRPDQGSSIAEHRSREKERQTRLTRDLSRSLRIIPYIEMFEREKHHQLQITECYYQLCDRSGADGSASPFRLAPVATRSGTGARASSIASSGETSSSGDTVWGLPASVE